MVFILFAFPRSLLSYLLIRSSIPFIVVDEDCPTTEPVVITSDELPTTLNNELLLLAEHEYMPHKKDSLYAE